MIASTKVKVHIVKCDRCGVMWSKDKYNAYIFYEERDALRALREQPYVKWRTIGDKHYCPNCYKLDENGNPVIKT